MSSIIKHAQADTTDNVKGHTPEAPHSTDFSNPSENVGNLRFVIFPRIYAQKLSVRVLRAAVFRRLKPITNLQSGEDFMKVWFQCVQNHYARWERGMGHTDPSIVDLMTNPFDKSKDVFNDWDLATVHLLDNETLPHSERTGTPPFMALDLLSKAYYDGEKMRLYRHDLEALIWILPWVFLQYRNGNKEFDIFRSWQSADYKVVRDAKSGFLQGFQSEHGVGEDSSFYNEWLIAMELLTWLKAEDAYRTIERGKPQHMSAPTALKQIFYPDFIDPEEPEPTLLVAKPEKEPRQVYIEFWRVIAMAMRKHPKELNYVRAYIPKSI